jgi:hypothetical protein
MTGDMEGLGKELLRQVGSEAEWGRMNMFQRQALAKAMGMSVKEVGNLVGKQELLNKAASGQLTLQEMLAKGMSLPEIMGSDKMMTVMEKLKGVFNKFIAVVLGPFVEGSAGMFQNIETFADSLSKKIDENKGFLENIGKGIASLPAKIMDATKRFMKFTKSLFAFKAEVKGAGTSNIDWAKTFGNVKKAVIDFIDRLDPMIKNILGITAAFLILVPIFKNLGATGAGVGALLKGMAVGLSSLGAVAGPAALGIGVITLGMLGFAVGLAAVLKAIEFGEKGFKLLGDFLTNVLGIALAGLVPIIATLMPYITQLAEIVSGTIIGAMEAFGGIIESVGNSISKVVDSIGNFITDVMAGATDQFERIAAIGPGLITAGGGIGAVAIGMAAFAGAKVADALTNIVTFFTGDPIEQFREFASLASPLSITADSMEKLADQMERYTQLPIAAMVKPTLELAEAMGKFKDLESVALNVQVAGMPEFNTTGLESRLDDIKSNLIMIDEKLDTTGPIAQANRLTSDELYQLGK